MNGGGRIMNNILITVDKRTELLGILLLISDYNKTHSSLIEECGNKDYREKIFTNFLQFKNEKAVKLLNKIFDKHNFSYDAPVSLFLQLNEDFTFSELDDYPFKTRLKSSQLVLDFLNELPKFAQTINFEEFYNSNKQFYNDIIEETKSKIDVEKIVNFIFSFYKMDISKIKYILNLLPYTSRCNFGTNHNFITYSNVGLKRFQQKELTFICNNDFGTLALHEFSHSIINPLTSKYSNIKRKSFADIWDVMVKKAYGNVETIINEHIIRALEIFYLKNILKTKETINLANECLEREMNNGFKYIADCLNSLEFYYTHIDDYEDFEQYFPTLIQNLNNATKKN